MDLVDIVDLSKISDKLEANGYGRLANKYRKIAQDAYHTFDTNQHIEELETNVPSDSEEASILLDETVFDAISDISDIIGAEVKRVPGWPFNSAVEDFNSENLMKIKSLAYGIITAVDNLKKHIV